MAKGAGDIGKLTMKVDSSDLAVATKRLERLRDLVRELERDHGIKVSAVIKAKARAG